MRKLSSILIFLVFSLCIFAVPATREPIVRILADGRMDTVYLHGDEYGSYYGDKPEETPFFRRMYKAPQRELRSAYVPRTGNIRIPVLLVNFKDLSFTLDNPVAQFDDLFNGNGGSNPNATGSVRTYYEASSNGLLILQYDVYGPFNLSQDMAYYGANKTNSSGVTTNHNIRAKELVTEAAQLAVNNGVDFSMYDNDNDGAIDNLSIVVAGYNEAEGGKEETIWPHYSIIQNSKSYNGKYLSGYLMISEYRSSGGKMQAGIGTYCHEFGHALGLPDLYDTENDNYTVGYWDIMCSGSYNNDGSTPPSYTAFERFVMGWLTPEQISTSGMRTLEPIETSNKAYLMADRTHNMNALSPIPTEYFLIENRQCVGWDAGKEALVAPGLFISHITFNQTTWDYNTFNAQRPLGFDMVSAGFDKPSQSSAADIFPGTTLRTSWVPTFNDGKTLDTLALTQIRQRGDLCISMQVGASAEDMLSFETDELRIETTYDDGKPIHYDTALTTLHIPAIEQDSVYMMVSSASFRFSTDNGKQWFTNKDTAWISIIPDSTYSLPIQVVYQPSRQNCTYTYAYLTVETNDYKMGTLLTLAGRAPRPTYITTPVIDTVTNLNSTSFTIQWNPQEDAEWFYYMLYTVGEGESEETESFNQFSTLDEIHEAGWDANFIHTQSQISHSGDAVLFGSTGQMIQTPMYLYVPKAITLWISNNYTPNSADETTGGMLTLMGSIDGQEWEKAGKLSIQRTTKNVDRTIELDTTHHWKQFRLIYTHTGGNGGVVIDDWRAVFDRDIRYIYRLKEYYIDGAGHEIVFRQLEPSTTYYYAMQAYESKGCEPHYSSLCEPYAIRTRDATENPQLEVIRIGEGQYELILPEMADGKHYLTIYTYTGELLTSLRPAYSTSRVTLPKLPIGQLYLLKYYTGSMNRKDINAKILSH